MKDKLIAFLVAALAVALSLLGVQRTKTKTAEKEAKENAQEADKLGKIQQASNEARKENEEAKKEIGSDRTGHFGSVDRLRD